MTGLEKIIAEIQDEAAQEGKALTDKADAAAQKVLDEAKAESAAKAERILAAAQQEVKDIELSRQSAVALQRRQQMLAKKQVLLSETLQKAQSSLYELPVNEYFNLLVRLAKGAAQSGEGILFLNADDLKRMPADFEVNLSAALAKGATLSIATDTRPIDGGFVLKYGDVEQNCSFEAIFNARADEFSDLVRDVLFA